MCGINSSASIIIGLSPSTLVEPSMAGACNMYMSDQEDWMWICPLEFSHLSLQKAVICYHNHGCIEGEPSSPAPPSGYLNYLVPSPLSFSLPNLQLLTFKLGQLALNILPQFAAIHHSLHRLQDLGLIRAHLRRRVTLTQGH